MSNDDVWYLSGPMTGYENFNYPAFQRATLHFRSMGMVIISPHEIPSPATELADEQMWEYYIAACLEEMKICNKIIMLEGWPESRGAKLELERALKLEMQVYFYWEVQGFLIKMSRRQ
jgi:hypothetical protein